MEPRVSEVALPKPHGRALVGCYTPCDNPGLVWLSADDSGLAVAPASRELTSASWLEWLDDNRVLAVREQQASTLALVQVDREATVLAEQPTHGADACHIAVSPGRTWVAVSNYSSGSMSLFRCPEGVALDPAVGVLQCEGGGPIADRQAGAHCHQATWLDDEHLLLCDLGADLVRVVRVSPQGPVEIASIGLPGGFGPRHLVLRQSPNPGRLPHTRFCLAGELSGQLAVVRHEGDDWTGRWVIEQLVAGTTQTLEAGHLANIPSGLVAFGDDLVLANRGCNTIARFTWAEDGALAIAGESPCGGEHPRDLVEHAGHLWVANQHSNSVVLFGVDESGFVELDRVGVDAPARLLFG